MNTLSAGALYRAFIIALFASLWHAPLSAATQPTPSARDVAVETSERLIAALQENREAIRQDLGKAYELAEATVMPHLDFTRITRWVLGKHWRAATAQQRQRLTDEFRTLLTRSYVSAMV
ncbi:MAG: ABC transporter substrate-binding protein, partial [Thiohalobacteraceae bacterium]